MTFTLKEEAEGFLLSIEGELDANSVTEVRATLDRIVAARPRKVVVELSGLRLIDSSGVGAIVSLFKRVRAAGGEVTVKGVRDQPLAIFKLLRLDQVMSPVQVTPAS
jgi:anti-sigma B factor antagonist